MPANFSLSTENTIFIFSFKSASKVSAAFVMDWYKFFFSNEKRVFELAKVNGTLSTLSVISDII